MAVGGAASGAGVIEEAGEGAGAIVIVRPSLLKLASSGTGPLTVTSTAPLFSLKVAEEIALSLKLTVSGPEGTKGSRRKIIVSFPGSVPIVGLTGELKFKTSLGGVVFLSSALYVVPASLMKSLRAVV